MASTVSSPQAEASARAKTGTRETRNPLQERLAGVRGHHRFVSTVRGVSCLLAVVLAFIMVMGVLDWGVHLPPLVRALGLVTLLTGAGVLFYQLLYRPLTAPDDDLTLALKVEERFVQLNDALASTVQFLEAQQASQMPDMTGASSSMTREAIRRAMARAASCDFNAVVDSRWLWSSAFAAVLALALAVTLFIVAPTFAGHALVRFVHPFGGYNWPTKTQLELEPPRTRIGQNEAYTIQGTVRGVIPAQATVIIHSPGFSREDHRCEITTPEGEEGTGYFKTTLAAGRIKNHFRFHVRANDARTEEYAVEVVAPPTLVDLDTERSPQVRLYPPEYTDPPSAGLKSSGNIEAVTGTRVVLRARANRALARAWIDYQPQVRDAPVTATLATLGTTHLPGFLVSLAGGRSAWAPVSGKLNEEDPSLFSVEFVPSLYGHYTLWFEDETGLSNSRSFELRVRPDPRPKVQLVRPSQNKDVLQVLPQATLPLDVVAEDIQYGLCSVYLEYQIGRSMPGSPEGPQATPTLVVEPGSLQPPQRWYLHRPEKVLRDYISPWAGVGVLASPPPRVRLAHLEFQQDLPVSLFPRDGSFPGGPVDGEPLRAGDVLILQACADDHDDVTVGKEPGRSHRVEIFIVTPPQLDLVLNTKQTEVQQELTRLLESQRGALKKVTDVESLLKKGDPVKPEQLFDLLQAERTQQQIQARVKPGGQDRGEGLRAKVAQILRTLKQNKQEHSAARDRMERVASELDRISAAQLRRIPSRLTEARKQAELLDPKVWSQRRIDLKREAEQAEREAVQAEKDAARKQKEAAELQRQVENQAQRALTERGRQQKEQEARGLRQRAETLRAKAQALKQRAASLRREAAQPPNKAGPRKELALAQRDQEEVEKTLKQLLVDLEPWSNLREVKGEAGQILQEQRRLQAQVSQMQKKGMNGLELKDLKALAQKPTPEGKKARRRLLELDTAREAQGRLRKRIGDLVEKMKRVSKQRTKTEPERAADLKEAADLAEEGDIAGDMQRASDALKQNQLGTTQQAQKRVEDNLKALLESLEDRREAELDRLAKKIRKAQQKLAELAKEQELLRKKVREAQQIPDAGQRQEALQRLGQQQQGLRKQAEEMAEQLSRLRSERARQAMERAREQMEDAVERLTREQKGEQEQQDALGRLQEAQRELEQARQEVEEELRREQLRRVANAIKLYRDRQARLIEDARDLQKEVRQLERWDRALRAGPLEDLVQNQDLLGDETKQLASKDLQGAPVFARLTERTGETMKQASSRFAVIKRQAPDPQTLPDEEATRLQDLALRRLSQLVEAIEEAAKMPRAPGGQAGNGGQGGAGGRGAPGDGIPPLAQLKLLKTMQEDVNQRTDAFRKKHPELKNLDDQARKELESIRTDQKDVKELVEHFQNPS